MTDTPFPGLERGVFCFPAVGPAEFMMFRYPQKAKRGGNLYGTVRRQSGTVRSLQELQVQGQMGWTIRAGEEDIIGYIGQGFSDQCAAEYADIVFAKDDLQRYCQEKNISYYPYQAFDDVVERLALLLKRKRLRKRRRAGLKRREAFAREA